ncbi:MAG: hypothetical protein HY873_04600 [Chloroflexi bacterium]|nr:hypothetical protein [Chloroflexota bacterium]
MACDVAAGVPSKGVQAPGHHDAFGEFVADLDQSLVARLAEVVPVRTTRARTTAGPRLREGRARDVLTPPGRGDK